MSGRYSPTRAQPQTIDDLRRWVQSELDRISVALSQNEVIYGPLDRRRQAYRRRLARCTHGRRTAIYSARPARLTPHGRRGSYGHIRFNQYAIRCAVGTVTGTDASAVLTTRRTCSTGDVSGSVYRCNQPVSDHGHQSGLSERRIGFWCRQRLRKRRSDATGDWDRRISTTRLRWWLSQNPWLTNPALYFRACEPDREQPYLDGQITAALRDPYRQLTEQTAGHRSAVQHGGAVCRKPSRDR